MCLALFLKTFFVAGLRRGAVHVDRHAQATGTFGAEEVGSQALLVLTVHRFPRWLLWKGSFGEVYLADYNGHNAAAKVVRVVLERDTVYS